MRADTIQIKIVDGKIEYVKIGVFDENDGWIKNKTYDVKKVSGDDEKTILELHRKWCKENGV